ncbi:Conserved_hypothetical protein [Hexamita inflata]|uniref:Uncharacterized protein n=1 Tax=Hexamita inflata TaxID=28002 RepID=A0AA86U111_9EUKA|nr:Conserved hypothetical protein [Hexamita inflata]
MAGSQKIYDSQININLQFQVFQGALICIRCDIQIMNCTFIFIASGQQLSGLVIEVQQQLNIQQSFIQYRLTSSISSGLVNQIQQKVNFSIIDCKLTGRNLIESNYNGYIASNIQILPLTIFVQQFQVCANNISALGNQSLSAYFDVTHQCDICGKLNVVYGLCLDSLIHGQQVNGELQCVHPYIFSETKCVCDSGYMFNGVECINIIESMQNISSINYLTQNRVSDIEIQLSEIDNSIAQNTSLLYQQMQISESTLENFIASNYSQSQINLQANTTELDNRILGNATMLANDIKSSASVLQNYMQQNSTVLDWRIFNNISTLNDSVLQSKHDILQLFSTTSILNSTIRDNLNELDGYIKANATKFENTIQNLDQRIVQNTSQLQLQILNAKSDLESYIISNYSESQIQLLKNTTALDNRIVGNATLLSNNIKTNISIMDNYIQQNSTALDQRIHNNVSILNVSIADIKTDLLFQKTNLSSLKGQIIDNLTILGNTIKSNFTQLDSQIQVLDQRNQQNISQLQTKVQFTQTTLENFIASNYSQSQINLQANTTELDNRILGNATMLANDIKSSASVLQNYMQQNSTVLDWRIFNNISALNDSFTGVTSNIMQNVSDLTINYNVLDNFTKQFKENQTQENQEMKQVITSLGQQINCLSNDGKFINGLCLTNYIVNCSENLLQCSQLIYIGTFDQYFVTYQITTANNFSSGYVFNQNNVVQNAFIDVYDNVYQTVNPLFQSQNSFTNIKIQFGTQSIDYGSILTPSQTITINQMNIVSKDGSTLTSTSYLCILQRSSANSNIRNLLVNLTITMQSTYIQLISQVSETISINGYQVLGTYQCSSRIAMISATVDSAVVNVKHVSFKPSVYNVGNSSSYFFSNVMSSKVTVSNIAIIIGCNTNQQDLTSISTNSSYQYQFGGIVTEIYHPSQIVINNVVLECYQQIETNFTSNSGFLVGYGKSNSSSIIITNLCVQQKILSSKNFTSLGLIGLNEGNISLQQANVIIYAQGAIIYYFAIVGYQVRDSKYAEVINFRTLLNLTTQQGHGIGSIFGYSVIQQNYFNNVSITNSSIFAENELASVGLFIGISFSNMTILNATIQQSVIQCVGPASVSYSPSVAGFIGLSYSNISAFNVSISNSNISCLAGVGAFISDSRGYSEMQIHNHSIIQCNISGYGSTGGFIESCSETNLSIHNSIITMSTIYNSYTYCQVGGFIGSASRSNMVIQNYTVSKNSISGTRYVAGFYGFCSSTNISLQNSIISQSNITCFSYAAGGLFADTESKTNLTVSNQIITQVRITSPSSFGIVIYYISYFGATLKITNSSSSSNYINDVLQADCATLTNNWSVTQCT